MTGPVPTLKLDLRREEEPCRVARLRLKGARYTVTVHSPWHCGRQKVEAFIRTQFFAQYGARPQITMPELVTLTDEQGDILAAVGLRPAQQAPLFLEHYLDAPIEQVIAQRAGVGTSALDACRAGIIEVGHLAGSANGMSRFLFIALTALLSQWEYQWIAFTGTQQVQNSFARLKFAPLAVAAAEPSRVPGGGEAWGSYYATAPKVMVCEIAGGYRTLVEGQVFAALALQIDEPFDAVAGVHHGLRA